MTATAAPQRNTRMSHRLKRIREAKVRAQIESIGGTFLRINWKKRTAHFLTPTGNKQTAWAA